MKYIILLTVFILQLSLARYISNDNETFTEFNISSDGEYIDLDGNVLYSPHDELQRFRRDYGDTCILPEKVTDFLVTCKSYPDRLYCMQHCPFGYTFPEAIYRVMKCFHAEDKWLPTPTFENCEPFVDCGVTLLPGGSYNCSIMHIKQGPECQISCSHYEDKEPVPKRTYKCDINGKWTPKLPFCAEAGSGIQLVPPPKGQKTFVLD